MISTLKRSPARLLLVFTSLLCLSTAVPTFAQNWQGGDRGGPMEHSFRGGEHGRWWDNPRLAQQIGLTDDQKTKMDDIFQQHRLQLIDLNATLQKDEVILQPLIQADQPDETKVLSQIDTIAQARAELEKANARMLFSIRKVLTPDQWKKLQTMVRNGPPRMDRDRQSWGQGSGRFRGPNGPGGPNTPATPKGPDGDGNGPPPPPPAQPNE